MPAQKKMIKEASKTNEHLITLVNDLLDVSRIEEGQFGYHFEMTDLAALVQKVVAEFAEDATQHDVTLSVIESNDTFPPISVDREKIRVAIGNLVDNAIKYTPKGGTVTISLKTGPGTLSLLVHDTGIGIAEKDQTFIFNKFFRAQNAVLRETEGSGLGLYIAKNIIEHHRGTVRLESRENDGSTFVIQLPSSPERMPEPVTAVSRTL